MGSDADQIQVSYCDEEITLAKSYEKFVDSLVKAIQEGSLDHFHPFIYGRKGDIEWLDRKKLGNI